MSPAVVALPTSSPGLPTTSTRSSRAVRIACTGAVTALSILGSMLVPTAAEAATVVGQGTYENDDAALALKGTWATVASSQASGGSTSSLSTAGYAELSFKTSGIRWISPVNGSSGVADVYLDGKRKATVDLYSRTTKARQVVYEVTGLPEKTHTLRIVRTGKKNARSTSANIQLDAFVAPDVHAPAAPTGLQATADGQDVHLSWSTGPDSDVKAYRVYRRDGSSTNRTAIGATGADARTLTDPARTPGASYTYDVVAVDTSDNVSGYSAAATVTLVINAQPAGTYQNDAAATTLNGAWSLRTSTMDSGGSYAELDAAGYAEISFTTSGIRWVSRVNRYSGIADVYLDGVKKASVDLYSASTKYQQVVYEVKGLPETPHTLRIVRTGSKNASASGRAITVDSFVAPDIYPPSAPTSLVATPKAGGVQLAWSPSPESDVVGYRLYRSALSGSSSATAVNTAPVPGVTYLDDGLEPGAAYRYQVVAVDAFGNESSRSDAADVTSALQALPAGTYEDDDTADIKLKGSWTRTPSSGANTDSGGSFSMLGDAGYAEMSFATSGIRWLARTNSYSGTADVYIDGVKKTTVDLYSSTTKYAQDVYEINGLPETGHTIRIVRTGARNASSVGRNISLDAFVAPDIHAPAAPTGLQAVVAGPDVKLVWDANPENDVKAYRVYRQDGTDTTRTLVGTTTAAVRTLTDPARIPGATYTYDLVAVDTSDNVSGYSTAATVTLPLSAQPAGTYEDDAAAVTLDGAWSPVRSTMDSGGSHAELDGPGYAEISFATSGIRWITRLNNYSGIADVYLDGDKKTSVDLYSSTTKYQQVAYEVTGLSETPHTLRIVRTGAKNDSSAGRSITLDSFVAPDIYAPSAPTSLVAVPQSGGVQLGWKANPESDVVGYRVYRTTGSSASFSTTAPTTALNKAPEPGITYDDHGLQPGSAYRYQITAVDAFGNESPKSAVADASVILKGLRAGTYEDDNTSLTLVGPWAKNKSTGANTDSGGSFSTLNANGYVEMSFGTSGVRWLARTNSSSGRADVYIDGVKKTTVDLYSSTTKYAQDVYEINGLPETGHTIRIVRTSDKNASSGGHNISLDAFVAPDLYAPSAPTAVQASPIRTGAGVSWTPSPEDDVASYRVFRRTDTGPDVLVGTTNAQATSFADVGLADATAYTWTVVARDTSNNDSPASTTADFTTPAESLGGNLRYATCPSATINATNRKTLVAALAGAKGGDVIRLAPGTYPGKYDITTVATADKPLWVCGPRTAVFDYGNFSDGYSIKVLNAANVVLAGVTVRNAQKGITVIGSNHITVADNRVEHIGEEAIHLKFTTTDSTVVGNSVNETGLMTQMYGEGVYIGTSEPNWCVYLNCVPDASNRNTVVLNDISNTAAENIEAKAGTEDGLIAKNTLDGTGMIGDYSDSNIGVMGNGWVVAENTLGNVPLDGIQVWEPSAGYGKNNTVYANIATTGIPGYTVRLAFNPLNNVVGCDNTIATGPTLGLSNKTCQN